MWQIFNIFSMLEFTFPYHTQFHLEKYPFPSTSSNQMHVSYVRLTCYFPKMHHEQKDNETENGGVLTHPRI